MKITINGEQRDFQGATLADLVAELALPKKVFAIAINATFVSRSFYESTQLSEGDSIEIVSPQVGG